MASKKTKTKKKPRKRSKALDRENYHLPVRSEEEQLEGLSEDLKEAWTKLRSFLLSLGEQGSHTSHKSIMFNRKTCYAFVRPKKSFIELNFFLPKSVDSPLVKKSSAVSKTKYVNIVPIIHADQVEEPITDWLREAYSFSG